MLVSGEIADVDHFIYHYPKQTNGLWIGDLPFYAKAIEFGG